MLYIPPDFRYNLTSYTTHPTRPWLYIPADLRCNPTSSTPSIPPHHGFAFHQILIATILPVQRHPFNHTMVIHLIRSSLQSYQFNAINSNPPWLYIPPDLRYDPTKSTSSIPLDHVYTCHQIFAKILLVQRHASHLTYPISFSPTRATLCIPPDLPYIFCSLISPDLSCYTRLDVLHVSHETNAVIPSDLRYNSTAPTPQSHHIYAIIPPRRRFSIT